MSAAAQSAVEVETLIDALERSRDAYLQSIESVPESAAGVKFEADGWSILQVAEHIAAVEHGMLRGLQLDRKKSSPPDIAIDQRIASEIRSRAVKLQSPEMVRPKGRWLTLGDCVEAFRRSRANTIEFVREAQKLREKSLTHPLLGEIDGHQAVLVIAGHTERHILQIEEIKASAAYRAAAESSK